MIVAVPTTITALAGLFVGLNINRKTKEIKETTDNIHQLTNSTLTNITTQRDVLLEKLSGMEKMVSLLIEDKHAADRRAATIAMQHAVALSEAQQSVPSTAHLEMSDSKVRVVGTFEGVPDK